MKILRILPLSFLLLLVFSCGKIDLIDDKAPSSPGTEGGGGSTPSPEWADSCHTVAELAKLETNTVVLVGGYIVGFVPGSSITKTRFTAEGAVETNIVLADKSDETDFHRCAPMQLVKGTDVRADLNLSDHPENLGQFVVLLGVINPYYYTVGLKPVTDYMFADVENPEGPTEPDPEEKPIVYPLLSKNPPKLMEGR